MGCALAVKKPASDSTPCRSFSGSETSCQVSPPGALFFKDHTLEELAKLLAHRGSQRGIEAGVGAGITGGELELTDVEPLHHEMDDPAARSMVPEHALGFFGHLLAC